jgi:hypothetical protein
MQLRILDHRLHSFRADLRNIRTDIRTRRPRNVESVGLFDVRHPVKRLVAALSKVWIADKKFPFFLDGMPHPEFIAQMAFGRRVANLVAGNTVLHGSPMKLLGRKDVGRVVHFENVCSDEVAWFGGHG